MAKFSQISQKSFDQTHVSTMESSISDAVIPPVRLTSGRDYISSQKKVLFIDGNNILIFSKNRYIMWDHFLKG